MALEATLDPSTAVDRTALNELVHWVKTLNQAGVSPDIAAQVAKDYFIATCSSDACDEDEYEDED